MKKLFLILILTISWSVSNGQLYPPIQPLNESGYSLQEFESFSLKSSEFSSNYRRELLGIVNQFLKETGLSGKYNQGMPLDEKWISWIFYPERTWIEDRTYSNGFWNSHQNGNKVVFYWDKRYFRGPVTTLHLDGYELDLGKTVCMNLVKIPYKTIYQVPPQNNPAPEPVPDRFIKTEREDNQFTQSVIIKDEEGYAKPSLGNLNPNQPKKERRVIKIRVGHVVITVAVVAIVVEVVHLILHKKDSGEPGGAPKTNDPPPVIIPPVVIPPGGPGGAPTTP